MANPQAEDGHIDIANEIGEALAKIRLSGEETQCLWVILRHTYGWHKKEDWISLSQFVLATGIKKSNVCRALSKMITKNVIIKKDNGNDITYQFQKDFDKWIPLSKKITLSKKIMTIIKKDKAGYSKKRHTKENTTKENITKENILSDVKNFIDFYYQEFKNRFGSPPLIQGGKDGVTIKRLLKTIPLEELQALLLKMFDSDDKFIRDSGYTIGIFQSQINKLKIDKPKHSGLRSWGQEIMEEEDGRKR